MLVYLASTNPHKLSEFLPLLHGAPFELARMPESVEVEETGTTFQENARLKARTCAERFGVPCLADDTGIAVHALDERPGIYSARYATTDDERRSKLLGELKDKADRSAAFHCALALVYPDGREVVVEAVVEGRVAESARGTNGFGYDPVFELPSGKTYAELTPEEKNVHSHRALAVHQLVASLKARS